MRCNCHKFGCLICDPMALSQGVSVDTTPKMPEPTIEQLKARAEAAEAERDRLLKALQEVRPFVYSHSSGGPGGEALEVIDAVLPKAQGSDLPEGGKCVRVDEEWREGEQRGVEGMEEANRSNVCNDCKHYMEWTTASTVSDITEVKMQCLKGAAYLDQFNIVTRCNKRSTARGGVDDERDDVRTAQRVSRCPKRHDVLSDEETIKGAQ